MQGECDCILKLAIHSSLPSRTQGIEQSLHATFSNVHRLTLLCSSRKCCTHPHSTTATAKTLATVETQQKNNKMKKYILAITAAIIVAGTITFVACTKDNPANDTQISSPLQQKSTKPADEITIAEWSDNGISYLFNKNHVLSSIQSQFKDSLNMNCIMEDIRISIKKVDKEDVPVISISYFDLDNEVAVTMFGILTQHSGASSPVMLALGCGEISARCIGVNCKKGCDPIFETYFGNVIVLGCTDCKKAYKPGKPYSCNYSVTQGLVSRLVFDCFQMDIL